MRFLTLIIVVGLLATVLLGWGLLRINFQAHKIATYEPARAMVLHVSIQRDNLGFHTPYITYRYQIGNRLYSSSQYAPLNLSGSKQWATSIASHYYNNKPITVYVSPENPTMAFLTPNASFTPYFTTMLSILIVFFVIFMIHDAGILTSQPASPATLQRYHWHRLIPEHTPQLFALAMIFIPLLAFILLLLPLIHYLLFAYTPNIPDPLYLPLAFALIASSMTLIPAFMGFKKIKVAKYIKYVRLYTNRPTLLLSAPITIRTDILFVHAVTVQNINLSLNCYRLTGTTRELLYKDTHTLHYLTEIKPGQTCAGSYRLDVPQTKQRPSSPFSRIDYPRIEWQFHVTITLKNKQSITWHFPITAIRHEH